MKIIRKIVTHYQPHLDEYLAMFIFHLFGWGRAHFVLDLQYGYITCNVGGQNLVKNNPDHLFLGVGGGPFDDHGKRDGKSCSQLVCEFLEICYDLRIRLLVKRVTLFDKQGAQTPNKFTLPEAINLLHRQGLDDKIVREWTMKAIWAIFESEAILLEEIRKEVGAIIKTPEVRDIEVQARFESAERSWYNLSIHKIADLIGEEGKEWLSFATDAFARQESLFKQALQTTRQKTLRYQTKFGPRTVLAIDGSEGEYSEFEGMFDKTSRHTQVRADIVLLRNAHGHTFVGVNQSARFDLKEFVGILRTHEAAKDDKTISKHLSEKEGEVTGHPQWFVHEGIGFTRVYNGTTTRPMIEPSQLSFEEIHKLLLKWLNARPIAQGGSSSPQLLVAMAAAFEE